MEYHGICTTYHTNKDTAIIVILLFWCILCEPEGSQLKCLRKCSVKTISSGKKPKDRNNSTVSSNNSKKAKQSEPEGHALNETVNNLNLIADNLLEKTEAINQVYLRIQDMSNKLNEKYTGLFSDSNNNNRAKGKSTPNKKRKERRRIKIKKFQNTRFEANKQHIRNLSNKNLTSDQINLQAKGLKFIPTPVSNEQTIIRQLLRDFEDFARRMRLQYMYHGKENERHPFYTKSDWRPPIQRSVALETYLEEVKISFTEVKLTKPKNR